MIIEQKLLSTLRELPLPAQQQILTFAEFVAQKHQARRGQAAGILSDLPYESISFEELNSVRREAWATFPRDITK